MKKEPSPLLVILAFLAVYFIWGSTFFFIELGVKHIAPMLLGGMRFLIAGLLMMVWLIIKREKIWNRNAVFHAAISGILMLFIGNGSVVWAEQYIQSSFVAIFIASAPLWFLVFDQPNWKENFTDKYTVGGILIGLLGIIALFYEKISVDTNHAGLLPLLVIFIGNIAWVIGSLYTKYNVKGASASVNSAWQILAAGLSFFIVGFSDGSIIKTKWEAIPAEAWGALVYLILFGSVIAYSAYIFLLKVRSAAQVSSYAYVNPLVAVVLGVFINGEKLTHLQILGLVIILASVLVINLVKMKREQSAKLIKSP